MGQGREDIKQKTIKFPVFPLLDKPEQPKMLPGRRPIIQIAERPILQQPQNIIHSKTTLEISVPETSQFHDKVIQVPNYII